jgi:hypothetical protein
MMDRRRFLGTLAAGAAGVAAARAAGPLAALRRARRAASFGKANRVIVLHMAGAPSQLELFTPKPRLNAHHLQPCPDELLQNERFAFIKGHPKLLGSPYAFAQHGASGAWISELLPETARVADRLTFVHNMRTEQFNHAPAQLFLFTGHALPGRPSLGAWLSWGLGTENPDLPAFVVLTSGPYAPDGGAAVWSSGFLPSVHQGVRFRSHGDPVLHLANPPGVDADARRRSLDALRALNERAHARHGDPETATRIAQYELAWRMQEAVPELADLADESQATLDRYGVRPGEASFAANALLARRLSERGVRIVQLHHWGWDSHGTGPGDDLVTSLPERCRQTDRACAALLDDLAERGLLDETLVLWTGEFGRTPMNEERDGSKFLGRDHHPHAFSLWAAGGGFRAGVSNGETDELGYHVAGKAVSVHDLHATLLHLLGVDHETFTFRFQGRDFRLTDVAGEVQVSLLA